VLPVNVANSGELWKTMQGKLFCNSKLRKTHDAVASTTRRKVLKSWSKLSVIVVVTVSGVIGLLNTIITIPTQGNVPVVCRLQEAVTLAAVHIH
jgi:hypothetical protein